MLVALPIFAQAVKPDELRADPALKTPARVISMELRCDVCIDSSYAGVARDLQLPLRDRLTAGDSNEAVIENTSAHYVEYVPLMASAYAPDAGTLTAAAVLAAGAYRPGLLILRRSRRGATPDSLDCEFKARIAQAMVRQGQGEGR
ncbi:cytochrome c-type biogenesis protein CcmH [Maliponia aquimaris]|uniref:cytochrome c-type biogenesis protein CcmH n=1 Tax=Maliponia aquimaris TaxID=1673631 RepID=UPI000B8B1D62|nr:cytochrome c-type biogenesis protein CcmH [Maliponia aquimaris]